MSVTLVGTPDPDQFRREPICEHAWRFLDTFDLWYCTICKRHESPDDDPDGPVAACQTCDGLGWTVEGPNYYEPYGDRIECLDCNGTGRTPDPDGPVAA